MPAFIETIPKTETLWRAIILFGRNVASYKFALGKALLELADKEKTFIKLDELAGPYSRHLVDHVKKSDKQCISSSSKFLEACRDYDKGKLSESDLISKTVSLGFNNVIDAFHIVGSGEVPKRFFIDERKGKNGITITDELLRLKENIQFSNFPFEVESRWRLVETAWSLSISPALLRVRYDIEGSLLFVESDALRRINITSCRDSLNGYQKGKCFFCFRDIVVDTSNPDLMADVDHFFPHILLQACSELNVNGIWNLVLSCKECNRGEDGKFSSIPHHHLLVRLFNRNEFLIQSHHPLRETLMNQTGVVTADRIAFLQGIDSTAHGYLPRRWKPQFEDPPAF